MLFVMTFGVMLGSRVGMLVGQAVLTIRHIGCMGFLLVFASLVELLGLFVIFGGFTEMVSGFFVMFVCHVKRWYNEY